mgnify:CR=1 FL=1
MKSEHYDIAIIGAGPAGLSCALELQKSDLKIVILEKNKIVGPKVCAGGLTHKISNLGLDLKQSDRLFDSVDIVIPYNQQTISQSQPFVGTIDRGQLGQILLKNISPQIKIYTGSPVIKIAKKYLLTKDKKITFKYLIGADGSMSLVRKYLGLPTTKFLTGIQYLLPINYQNMQLHFDAALFGSGYAWIFPHKKYTSIGCGRIISELTKKNNLLKNFQIWLEKNNFNISNSKLQGSIINYDYRGFDFGENFLIGDAAGLASGLTGEGIYFGIISGQEVAKKIINRNYSCSQIKNILNIKRKHEQVLALASFLDSCHLLSTFYRLLPILFRSNWFTKKAINLFC